MQSDPPGGGPGGGRCRMGHGGHAEPFPASTQPRGAGSPPTPRNTSPSGGGTALTEGPGGPTLPAAPGKPVAPCGGQTLRSGGAATHGGAPPAAPCASGPPRLKARPTGGGTALSLGERRRNEQPSPTPPRDRPPSPRVTSPTRTASGCAPMVWGRDAGGAEPPVGHTHPPPPQPGGPRNPPIKPIYLQGVQRFRERLWDREHQQHPMGVWGGGREG